VTEKTQSTADNQSSFTFPEQGPLLNERVSVRINPDTSHRVAGTIVRQDAAAGGELIIEFDNETYARFAEVVDIFSPFWSKMPFTSLEQVCIRSPIDLNKFPKQGRLTGERVYAHFHGIGNDEMPGTLVRDDMEKPFESIIKLDDGRFVRGGWECTFRILIPAKT